MSKWKCNGCGAEFDRPYTRKLDDDFKYGDDYLCCPNCESVDIIEEEEE